MSVSNCIKLGDMVCGEVSSHSSNIDYIVSYDLCFDELFCSCPHFLYRLSRENHHYRSVSLEDVNNQCKHIKEFLNQMGDLVND